MLNASSITEGDIRNAKTHAMKITNERSHDVVVPTAMQPFEKAYKQAAAKARNVPQLKSNNRLARSWGPRGRFTSTCNYNNQIKRKKSIMNWDTCL